MRPPGSSLSMGIPYIRDSAGATEHYLAGHAYTQVSESAPQAMHVPRSEGTRSETLQQDNKAKQPRFSKVYLSADCVSIDGKQDLLSGRSCVYPGL